MQRALMWFNLYGRQAIRLLRSKIGIKHIFSSLATVFNESEGGALRGARLKISVSPTLQTPPFTDGNLYSNLSYGSRLQFF